MNYPADGFHYVAVTYNNGKIDDTKTRLEKSLSDVHEFVQNVFLKNTNSKLIVYTDNPIVDIQDEAVSKHFKLKGLKEFYNDNPPT